MRGLLIIPGLVVAAFGYVALDEGAGIRTWLHHRDELERADERIARLEAEITQLRIEVERLDADPFAIESAIREDLRFARAGETVVQMPPANGSNPRFP